MIDFLNELLRGKEQIEDLTYLNSENLGKTEADRKAIFDIYCQNKQGEKFITAAAAVEIQNIQQQYFRDRSIYYASFPIQEQAPKGEWLYQLKALYTIGILNFVFDDQKHRQDKLLHEVKLMETETKEIFYDRGGGPQAHVCVSGDVRRGAPKFRKNEEDLVTHFDKWLYVLKNLPKLQDRPKPLQVRVFKKIFKVAEIAKFNKKEMNAYEESLKVYRDNQNTMQYAIEKAVEKAVEKAKIDAGKEIKQAVDKATTETEERTEKVTREEIARLMKKDGDPLEKIARTTGLSQERIKKL